MDVSTATINGTKWVVDAIISVKVTEIAANAIANNTTFDKDGLPVKVASSAVGAVAGLCAKPATDKMIDKTVAFVTAKYAERKTKKDTPQQED